MPNELNFDEYFTDKVDENGVQILSESAPPMIKRLFNLLITRTEFREYEREISEKRKQADAELKEAMHKYNIDILQFENLEIVETKSRGAGKWSKQYLETVLTPIQLSKAYEEGTEYTYLRERKRKE